MDRALEWDRGTLKLLDQSALPRETRVIVCATVEEVAEAIRSMKIRGAPAIGAAAAYGLVLAVQTAARSEERRVGKEWRSRWAAECGKKKGPQRRDRQ